MRVMCIETGIASGLEFKFKQGYDISDISVIRDNWYPCSKKRYNGQYQYLIYLPDRGGDLWFSSKLFITEQEFRDKQLEKIGI
jgi:hypothetical protein